MDTTCGMRERRADRFTGEEDLNARVMRQAWHLDVVPPALADEIGDLAQRSTPAPTGGSDPGYEPQG